ncbi:MAG: hypothetical protein AB3N14_19255 [Flavobacteriaceae bacterium]
MAKIASIKLSSLELKKVANTDLSRVQIRTCLEFHPLDLRLGMEYQLHLFLFDTSTPLGELKLLINWDEVDFFETSFSKAGILDHIRLKVSANNAKMTIESSATVSKLENLAQGGIRVFGTLVPVISRATSWSNTYLFNPQLK